MLLSDSGGWGEEECELTGGVGRLRGRGGAIYPSQVMGTSDGFRSCSRSMKVYNPLCASRGRALLGVKARLTAVAQ